MICHNGLYLLLAFMIDELMVYLALVKHYLTVTYDIYTLVYCFELWCVGLFHLILNYLFYMRVVVITIMWVRLKLWNIEVESVIAYIHSRHDAIIVAYVH